PLNTIRLWSNMLSTGRVPLTQGSEGVKAVERAAIAQQQLIDDLLDVSRMATGKLRLVARDIVLAQAVADAIEAVRPIAERRNVSLETEIGEDVGIVHVDPDRMQQVVWNLLTNAVKFTPSGGHVRVSLRRIADDVDIVVTDTGIGIRRDVVPHIFERFRQADSGTTRQHGGLGLGLAIAKQLVELHGGTIGVESEGEGRGASFRVRLPNLKRLPGEAQSDSTRVQLSLDLSGVDVLLVEDEEPARAATARLLEMHGAQVRMVTTVAGAREAFAMQRPDVIVADVGLPGEDGYSLMRSIRQLELAQNTASVPAIAVTAFARPEDRRAALEAGFSDHVPKPLDPARFIVAIANLLRSR
ncbi:MAG: sensor hybrid histidine kinase, partial [Gammaproteobacteria bacterium]|nr:sensor hybrid histidine kinase [Gammaproteobacteria bacterium]